MKNLKLILVFAVAAFTGLSCERDEPEQLGGGSTAIVGFTSDKARPGFVTDGEVKPYSVPVQVIGGNKGLIPTADITVSYEVDVDASSAVLGTHFDLSGSSVVIPAGGRSALIPMTVNTENLVIGDDKVVVLHLTTVVSENDVIIATNYDTVSITLVGLCFSDLAGTYYIQYADGTTKPVVVTEVAPGSYEMDTFPGITPDIPTQFVDVCGVLTITGWDYSLPAGGSGTVSSSGNLVWTGLYVQGIMEGVNVTLFRN